MHLFNDVKYLRTPTTNTNVVFSCDDIYFHRFGIDNIQSCITAGLIPHCHVINPSEITCKKLLTYNISASIEFIDIQDAYLLKTYYYCSRFFISLDLFNKFDIEYLWISDADVLFNNKPIIPDNKTLGISYNADQESLWKQTQASLIYVNNAKKDFLANVISIYLEKIENFDFSILDTITDKYERGNILGLDQVCMSLAFSRFYKGDPAFINLHDIPNLKSKKRNNGAVTILVGKNKLK